MDSRRIVGLSFPVDPLTRREQEILEHLEKGLTNIEIAEVLVIAESTVKGYTRQIYQKLGVNSRREAVQRARQIGLLAPLTSQPGNQASIDQDFLARKTFPIGTITFLFTDIKGSMSFWESYPDQMTAALQISELARSG